MSSSASSSSRVPHPYARIYAKKDVKRRRIWNHALEKSLFSAHELSSLAAPHRRTIYIASLESHINALHAQLLGLGHVLASPEQLNSFKGVNSKTVKSIISGLQYDINNTNLKLLELQRANDNLRRALATADANAAGVEEPKQSPPPPSLSLPLLPATHYSYSTQPPPYSVDIPYYPPPPYPPPYLLQPQIQSHSQIYYDSPACPSSSSPASSSSPTSSSSSSSPCSYASSPPSDTYYSPIEIPSASLEKYFTY